MFCDLVESTALSQRLDPEDLRRVIRTYQETCSEVVQEFEGYVAQYLGDGLLVYFSYPQAHEDDAERAVRAGLQIVARLRQLDAAPGRGPGVRLAVRIGIHTGQAVVGIVGGGAQRETLALGHTVNLAARIKEVATPDSVVLSDATLQLVRGIFVTEDLGVHTLKGIAHPVALHRAIQPSGVRSRLDLAGASGLTPLVGRAHDLDVLLDRWSRASEGQGQVVLVNGEPGIGKSRLMRTLRERLAAERHTWLECRASPYHRNSAFHPVIALLRQGLRLGDGDPAGDQLRRVEEALDRAGLDRGEALPLVAALLSLPLPDGDARPELSPEARRRKTLETLTRWIAGPAGLQPTVLVVEDLHWSDPSSLELLGRLIERVESIPLLLVATYRPVFEPTWPPRRNVLYTIVGPLTRPQTTAMVRAVAGGRPLPAGTVDQLVRQTDGVPLFVEELTKSVVEAGLLAQEGAVEKERAAELAIPTTLQDSLMARLDRLGPAKSVAQMAAVLGREFSQELLAAVSRVEGPVLREGLSELVRAGFLYARGDPPATTYTFKHALIHEAAYQSLLKATRRSRHAEVARVLGERFPARVGSEPEEMARHCEEGGLVQQAIEHYRRAGERAAERSANAEAIGHLARSIELLETLPEGVERDRQELTLQVALGRCLVAATGWGSVEAEQAYARARELSERTGETPELFQVIRGLITFYVARSELETARELCKALSRLAEGAADTSRPLLAHQQMSIVAYFQGRPRESLEHAERALALYEPDAHRPLIHFYGEDLAAFIRIWMAWTLWIAGHPDRSLLRIEEAIALGRESGHPFSFSYALLWGAVVRVMRRENAEARELAAAASEIGRQQDFGFVRGGGLLVHALASLEPGLEPEAIDAVTREFRQAVVQLGRAGSIITRPKIFGHLADAYLSVERLQEAGAALDAALNVARQTSQPFWNADLFRLEGELALRTGGSPSEAERHFVRGIELARSQQARMLELRAAVSLARLWVDQGKPGGVRDLLGPLYGAFTEGFDTVDLKAARELLAGAD